MEVRKGHQIPGTGFSDDCQLPCGYSKLNVDSLEMQQVLLKTDTSPQTYIKGRSKESEFNGQ